MVSAGEYTGGDEVGRHAETVSCFPVPYGRAEPVSGAGAALGNGTGSRPWGEDIPDDSLARTLAAHIHCGEPMQVVGTEPPPITQPLMILPSAPYEEPVQDRPAGLRTYRCRCGFTLDESPDLV